MAQASDVAAMYVARQPGSRITATNFHLYPDCSFIDDATTEQVTEREVELLGLKKCRVCERRETGGPAVEILEGFFGEDWPYGGAPSVNEGPRETAWKLKTYLEQNGAYISVRKKEQS